MRRPFPLRRLQLALLPLVALAPPAAAQTLPSPAVELHQFHASPFWDRTLRLDGTDVLPSWKLNVGLDADYAFRPLVVSDASAGGGSHALVRHAAGLGLRASLGLGDRFELAALVPVTAYQTGDALAGVEPPSKAGLEAVRLGAKARLLGDGRSGPGLGIVVLAVIPTGSAGGLVHEDGFGGEARAFGDLRTGAVTLSLGAGVRLRKDTRLYDIALGNELLAAAAAQWHLDAQTSFFGELAAATPLDSPASSAKQTPLELLVGARERTGALTFFGALGPGLAEGYGTPVVRFVAGISWSDAPLDVEPPRPVAAVVPVVALDTDKDGIPDARDKCPREPETKNGYKDDDGCPDPDNDKDGIPDAMDKCPAEPETINNVKDDDGCPDKGIVTLKEGELETLTPIFFEKDRARVRHAFRASLDDIAAILKAHPEIGRCAVEGHADATGPADWNKKLSLERAKSVAVYLISKGVDPARVAAIGQGDALPWASNQTEAGRAANRRVIFHIEGVGEEQEKKQLELQKRRVLQQPGVEEAK